MLAEVPSPPTGPLEFSEITKTTAVVSWKPPKDNGGSPIMHYIVEKREARKTSYTQVEKLGPKAQSCKIQYLLENTEYFIQVRAQNKVGVSQPLASDKPLVPKHPYSKSVSDLLKLTWRV
jgi:titin